MRRTRKVLVLTMAVGSIASLSAWIGIKAGRPLYYSDGQEVVASSELIESGMLRWTRPEPRFEIPGAVRGRVTQLPDGRMIYGQPVGETRTDLMVFDPAKASQPARPVIELNSEGHDLSPVLGQSGRLFFASDRAGGAGGFDIYSAAYRDGIFFAVRPLPAGINTGLDESDPAIDRAGGQLAFVRRDPELDGGRNGRLMLATLGDPQSAKPVFALEKARRSGRMQLPPIDRDPAFAPDGLGVYFVRERFGQLPVLMRTFWHRDRYVPPVAVKALLEGGPFRGPTLVDGGFGIQLTSTTEPVVVYHAAAEEVYPYLEGQWWLEWLLLSSGICFALLLMLLILGARWNHLDAITKLLLLSMLIHLVILLWLSRMEIIRSFEPKAPGTGRVEVHLVAKSANTGDSGTTEVHQNLIDVSRSLQFEGYEETVVSDSPGTALEQTGGELASSEVGRTALQPTQIAQDAQLIDRAEQAALRTAQARSADYRRREMRTEADASHHTQVRAREHTADQIRFDVPGAGLTAEFLSAGGPLPRVSDVARSLPLARPQQDRKVAVGDVQLSPTVRTARADSAAAVRANQQATRALSAAVQPVSRPPFTWKDAGVVSPVPRVQPARRSIAAAPARRSFARRSSSPLRARAREVSDQTLRDSLGLEAARGLAKGAKARSDSMLAKRLRPAEQKSIATGADRVRLQGPASAAIVASRPDSALELEKARHDVMGRRRLPRHRQMSAPPMAMLSDTPPAARESVPTSTRRMETRAVAAIDLDAIRHQDKLHDLKRDSTSIAEGRPTDIKPESMIARHERRPSMGLGSGTEIPRARDLLAVAVDLEDLVEASQTARRPVDPEPESDVARALQRSLAYLRQDRALLGIARPHRNQVDPGLLDHEFGVRAPGSFLARANRVVAEPGVAPVVSKLTPYANRFGANKQTALKKYGGGAATERAVRKGLEYLASVQNDDGTWGDHRRTQEKYGQVFVGKTGLCLLAFLGAGHTPESSTEYSEVTRRAVVALLGTQVRGSHFGRSSSYSHGITTYALAECFALTKDKKLRRPLENAVAWILANQNLGRDRRNHGGWGYFSPTLSPEDRFSRSSASAWQIMALESAKLSGIDVPDAALNASRQFLLNNYDRRYRYFLYSKDPSRLRSEWRTLPASTPAAVFCLQLFGMDPVGDERLAAGIDYTLERAPRRYRKYSEDDFVLRGAGNVYFWYYGSLACFMAGGDTWDRWNKALKRVLIGGQSEDGSFRPIDTYADSAGDTESDRSYTTSMCVLSLEVYYRYFTPLLKHK